ncbi:MAG: hypothetical protein Kow0031_32970 [Anaerolineae bacterium]
MSDLLEQVQFVVNADGEQQAVLLNISTWREIVTRLQLLEDEEDAAELEAARSEDDDLIPWDQVKSDFHTAHNV